MISLLRHRKFFAAACPILLAGLWVTVTMVRPRAGRAQNPEMSAFVFPQVTVGSAQVVQMCGTQMGDGTAVGVMGLLDAGDATKVLVKTPFEIQTRAGSCVNLPAVQGDDEVNVIGFIAFTASQSWGASGRIFNASLQVRDENGTRFTVTPMFVSAVQIPN
jgi:hypothetical protein